MNLEIDDEFIKWKSKVLKHNRVCPEHEKDFLFWTWESMTERRARIYFDELYPDRVLTPSLKAVIEKDLKKYWKKHIPDLYQFYLKFIQEGDNIPLYDVE